MNDNDKKFGGKFSPRAKYVPFSPMDERKFMYIPDMSSEEFNKRWQAELDELQKNKEGGDA